MKNILCLLLFLATFTACQDADKNNLIQSESTKEMNMPKATFVHTVYFWMKEGITSEEEAFFEKELVKLGTCPSILSYKWGKPAGTPREVVDNSYGYALIEEFANMEDQEKYQDDPIHLAFIENSKDLWSKVQVYDTIIE